MKKGVIEAVKKAKSGEKTYWTLKIDSDWYSLWGNLNDRIEKGSTVVFSYQKRKKDGKEYRNITELYPIGIRQAKEVNGSRVVALEAASRVLASKNVKVSQVITTAKRFENWLIEGNRRENKDEKD